MFRLIAYKFNSEGKKIAQYYQDFYVLEALEIKLSEIKNQFPKYKIYNKNKLISSNIIDINNYWRPM